MEIIKTDEGLTLSPQAAAELAGIETLAKEIDAQKKAMRAKLQELMEANNIIKIDTDELLVNYIAATDRETFNTKAFRKENPDLYDEYAEMRPVKATVRVKVK